MSSTLQLPDQGPRRIVTAHNAAGVAVVHIDEHVELERTLDKTDILGGNIWRTEGWPCKDNNEDVDGSTRDIPESSSFGLVPTNGTNIRSTDLAPGVVTPMHRTNSVDINILVKGRVVLILDDGSETELSETGSTVVQRGTIHAWRNPSSTEWTRWISVLIPAEPAVVDGVEKGPALEH